MDSNDNFEEEINKEIQEGFIKQIADKIVQGMDSLANATEDVKRRWIWELLQNAKDVPNKFGGVSVIVRLYKDKLLFEHNGDCFTIKNLTSLIQQVSSKNDQGDDPNVTGKFGTGFITTHLLSRKFTINGVAKSQTECCKRFTMLVDRDASCSRDMIVKIKAALDELRELKSQEVFENYEENRTEDDMDTTFEYPLTNETYEFAKIGCEDLLKVLPYSLLFIPKLKKATVYIYDNNNDYKKVIVQREGEIKGEGIEEVRVMKNEFVYKNDKEITKFNEDSTFVMNSEGRLNIVWPIKKTDDKTKIVRISVTVPKLFCSFPLIGSENFNQPMVINSGEFSPNEPRNTIFLRNQNTPQVKKNRELLIQANYLFQKLVQYSIDNKYEDFFCLFTDKPASNEYIDLRWLIDSTFTPRIHFLYKQNLVKTVIGVQASIKSMYFPKAATKELRKNLWELYRKYFHDNIVILDELEKWYEVLSATDYALDIYQFVKKISDAKCLSKMDQFDDDVSRINFINELIHFIKQSEKNDSKQRVSLTDYPIIPNRKGIFVPHKRLLSDREKPIPEEIKGIYYMMFEKSLDDILIHHSIKMELNKYQSYDSTKVLNDVNNELAKIKDDKNDKKKDISILMTELIPNEDSEEKETRLQILKYINDLDYDLEKKPIDDLPPDIWRISDQVVFNIMLDELVKFGKSKNPKPVNALAKCLNKNIDETMEWMNNYIIFMRSHNFNKVLSSPIIPRQDLYFGSLTYLSIDDHIPQTIKNILSNGDYDIYSQLIDNRITCFPNQQKMNITTIAQEILHQIDMKPPPPQRRGKNIYIPEKKKAENVYDITIKLICLQSETGNQLRKKFFDLIKPINFVELIPNIIPINMEEEYIEDEILTNLKSCLDQATRFLAKYIIDEIERKGDINDIHNIFKSNQQDLNITHWYIDFVSFMHTSGSFYREIVSNKVFLNQNGKFVTREAAIDVDHDENLLKISRNSIFNKDYKGEFVIPEIANILDDALHGTARKIRKEDIAKFIDEKIRQYHGSKQDSSFVSLILEIRDLFDQDPSYKSLMPYTSEEMEQLILNTLNSDTLSSIVKIVSEGKSELLKNLTDLNDDDIQNMMALKSGNISNALSSINSLDENDKQYLNDHPHELSNFIQAQRTNERIREQHRREMERLRQIRENRLQEMRTFLERRRLPTLPVFQRPEFNDIHIFTNFANQTTVHYEPPPPPPKPYIERLNNSLESLLRTIFKKVKIEKPNYFYCNIADSEEEEEENEDDYLIIPLFEGENDEIILDHKIIEFTTNFQETTILFIVPSEKDFDEETFKDDIKIISNIGFALEELQIVETIGNLISIDTDDFSFKGCEKYFVNVKKHFIDENMKSFDTWEKTFQTTDENDNDNDNE